MSLAELWEDRLGRGRAAAPLAPVSLVEYVFATAEAAAALGAADPSLVERRLVAFGLRLVYSLGAKEGGFHARFLACLQRALESVFGAQLPPFAPVSRAYRAELVEWLASHSHLEAVRRAIAQLAPAGAPVTDYDMRDAVEQLADRILYVALQTFFHEVGLLPLVKRWG